MAEEVPPTDLTGLPARLRVHALARALGVTSKQVLAALEARGEAVKSAQSSVDRATAEAVRDALTGATPAPAAVVAEAPAPAEAPEAPAAETAEAPAAEAPLFLPPEPVKAPPRRRRATRAAAEPDPVDPATSEPAPDAPTGTTAGSEAPAATATDTPAATPADDEGAATSTTGPDGDSDDSDDGSPRRRRRGRRGRGRGRGPSDEGEQNDDAGDDDATPDTAPAAATAAAETPDATPTADAPPAADDASAPAASGSASEDADDDGEDESGSGTRRRRRRRRRRSGGEGSDAEDGGADSSGGTDDPPDTVVHEREPRSKSRRSRGGGSSGGGSNGGGNGGGSNGGGGSSAADEVQGITGSTRLEAKRQRRKDGRDQGRRRPPILSEAEFLARREAVARTMVVRERAGAGEDSLTQVAVLEDGVLVEHFVTSSGTPSLVGNIYLGRVQNVLPSMEAAFIDIGRGRNGVLYAGEVDWDAAGLGGRSRKIEQALSSGDHVLVQVSKDPVGHKGARLTTQISLPGRFLVYVPGGTSTGISRKLPDTERTRLKGILKRIVPEEAGVIIRTASEGVSEEELARDVDRLAAQWESISADAETARAATPKSTHSLYEEPDLLVKVVRDLFNSDVAEVVVSGDGAWDTVSRYVEEVSPDLSDRLRRHDAGSDVFADFRVDEQLTKAMDRKVFLPSGGSLVIDRTEAMTVVDVNTGKYTGSGGNLEETVTRNNLEAAEEVVRQMRLRDIGGMIVVDFIDMVLEGNRDLVLRRLTECLGRDRTRHQVSEVTSLGLVQMTRKKLGQGLVESFSTPCEHCQGRGVVVQAEPVQARSTAPVPASGGDAKRGRSRGRSDALPATPPARVVPKGPHPAFLAAAKASAGDTPGTDAAAAETGVADVTAATTGSAPQAEPAAEPTPDAPAAAVEQEPVAPRARRSRRASRPTAAPEPVEAPAAVVPAVAPAEPVVPATPEDVAPEPVAQEPVAQEPVTPEPVVPEPVTPEPAPKARRSRRASRPTAAPEPVAPEPTQPEVALTVPEAEPAGAAPAAVETAGPADSSIPEDDSADPADTAAPAAAVTETAPAPRVRAPRRRAAGRPAGPPVDVDA